MVKSPKWLEDLMSSVCNACISDVKGRMSGFSYRWSKPEDNSWGTWLLMIAPSVIEVNPMSRSEIELGMAGFRALASNIPDPISACSSRFSGKWEARWHREPRNL